MSITRQDILHGAFTNDPHEVLELVLTQKGLRDVGSLANEAPNLTKLNLAFNQLTSLSGLASLTGLTWLSVSHNALTQLGKALNNLDRLTFLNLSNNKLTNIDGIAACINLQELYLQHNKLLALTNIQPIAQLSKLSKLCISGNPLEKKFERLEFRANVVAICPSLSVLDGLAITDTERQRAADVARLLAETAAALDTRIQSDAATYQQATVDTVSTDSLRPSSTTSLISNGSNRKSCQQRTDSNQPGSKPLRSTAKSPCTGVSSPVGQQIGNTNAFSDTASMAGSLSSSNTIQGVKKSRAAGNGIIRTLKELPPTSKFQEVLAALPQLDQARLPPSYSPGGPAATRKAAPVAVPAGASNTMCEIKYTSGARNCAVRCKQDGSLSINWPGGDLAITVDADYSCQPVTFRMLAMYRTTSSVAVSWDVSGGFVQYPDGSLCLTYSSHTGSGTLFDSKGSVLLKWSDSDEVLEPVDMLLDGHLGIRFCRRKQQLFVYFACEGVRYIATCGANKPEQTWLSFSSSLGGDVVDQIGDNQPAFRSQLGVQCSGIANKAQQPKLKSATCNDVCDAEERGSIAGVMAMLTALNTKLTS